MQRTSVKQSLLRQLAQKDQEIKDLKLQLAKAEQNSKFWVDRYYQVKYHYE